MRKDAESQGIPRPLVKTNQAFIVLSVLLSWVTAQYWILALPLAAGLSGLILKYNPVIKFAARFLRKERSAYALEDPEQQQFNQGIAVFCLAAGLLSFLASREMHSKISAIPSGCLLALLFPGDVPAVPELLQTRVHRGRRL
ncbi:DUF4395 domain-containing protein [Paenibacillus sonchi]|uniref:DUF4395 domain-containing protein n=1 Tax=Paenibacillus sonchi TaxID=373687 RepID=UPI001E33CC3B|nr:DUF4395 domain-containing protein [Paenibacillus sonchi]MCE3200818.1 DUF4395 domain-containing protein [Paenibacillus sonchi]